MSPQLIKKIQLQFGRKSDGSAITEFLIFTLPFFAALLLITLNVYQHSMAVNEAKNLARQSLRAFITSPNNEIAEARGNQVLEIYRNNLSQQDFSTRDYEIEFQCSNNPCLSPGGSVSAYLKVSIKGETRKDIIGTATEYVDLWR
jgi:hypothetical protein